MNNCFKKVKIIIICSVKYQINIKLDFILSNYYTDFFQNSKVHRFINNELFFIEQYQSLASSSLRKV